MTGRPRTVCENGHTHLFRSDGSYMIFDGDMLVAEIRIERLTQLRFCAECGSPLARTEQSTDSSLVRG